MKAVILAAGMGTRLKHMTEKLPKGLIEIDGKSLIKRSLDILKENGINNVIIVIGFYGNSIKQAFGENYNNINITYVENKEYSKTGSMYSFSKTKNLIDEDILLLECDILYEKKAIKTLLDSKIKDVILVSELLNSGDDVYICANKKSEITKLGKNIPGEDKRCAIGALVGISKLSKEFMSNLFKKAEEHYKNNELDYHYEECIFAAGKLGIPIHAELCTGLNWIEVDNEADLKRAKEEVYPKIKENEAN